MGRLLEFIKRHYYILTSILIFFSFPSYDFILLKLFPLFAWFAFVPLFLFARGKKIKDIFFYSSITGLIGFFAAFRWIGKFGASMPGGDAVILSSLIPFLSMFLALKVTLSEYISRQFERFRVLVFPSVWLFFDWLQSIGYMAYPGTYWGYTQYTFLPFIQLASITGIMGITFVIILFNYQVSDIIYQQAMPGAGYGGLVAIKRNKGFFATVVFILFVTGWGTIVLLNRKEVKSPDLKLGIIQSCISPWENWSENRFLYLDELKHYTEKSLEQGPDFIIWSESATLETISYDYARNDLNAFERDLLYFIKNIKKPLLTGEIGIIEEEEGFFLRRYPQNNAVLINGFGEVIQTYPKINLVPLGEWFPYENAFPLIKRLASSMGGSDFVPGEKPILFNFNSMKFGVLVCFEGIFYRLCREYKRMGADFLINITNDGWTDTYSGHMQHFSASVFRAIENGMWYVRAGNTGYTAVIDPFGQVVRSIPILEKGYLAGEIKYNLNHETVYSRFGDFFLYLVFLFLGLVLIALFYKKIKKEI